jgi:two-component system chemotaxis sensor kinase CheA
MDQLLAEFLTESREGLDQIDRALAGLEDDPGHAPAVALAFRILHTIKGTCGFLDLPRLGRVAHAVEEVLEQLREGQLRATPALIGAVRAATDRIRLILGSITDAGSEPAGDDAPILEALRRRARGEDPAAPPAPPPDHTGPAGIGDAAQGRRSALPWRRSIRSRRWSMSWC